MNHVPCIEVRCLGATHVVTYEQWSNDWMQGAPDEERIANELQESRWYAMNEGDPEFYVEFTVVDADELAKQREQVR